MIKSSACQYHLSKSSYRRIRLSETIAIATLIAAWRSLTNSSPNVPQNDWIFPWISYMYAFFKAFSVRKPSETLHKQAQQVIVIFMQHRRCDAFHFAGRNNLSTVFHSCRRPRQWQRLPTTSGLQNTECASQWINAMPTNSNDRRRKVISFVFVIHLCNVFVLLKCFYRWNPWNFIYVNARARLVWLHSLLGSTKKY